MRFHVANKNKKNKYMKKSISIVIPNYNGKSLLETNIPYVYNALETSEISDYEIIIPDDASADDSVNFICVSLSVPKLIFTCNTGD